MPSLQQSRTRILFSDRAAELFKAKKIGVALGPGLPSGLVDLGMLIALDQLKIPVSMISGTSMGAVFGALYATGTSTEEIREIANKFLGSGRINELIAKEMRVPGFGFSSANLLIDELIKITDADPDFYELDPPLFVIAADKISQQSVVFRHGKVFEAIRASLAMPLIITKHKIGDMKLADGAIFSPIHTNILYDEGADFVIGVYSKPIRSENDRRLPLSTKLEPYLLKMMGWKVTPEIYFSKPQSDILLHPRVPQKLSSDIKYVDEIINLGIKTTFDAIHEIEQGNYNEKIHRPETGAENAVNIKSEMYQKTEKQMTDLEKHLSDFEQQTADMSDGELMNIFPKFARIFQQFLDNLSDRFPDPNEASKMLKIKIKDITNLVNQSPFMKRCFEKPRGYAGDYQMMNYVYDNDVFNAQTNMGKLINFYLFSSAPTNAIRNRAKIIQGIIQQKILDKSPLKVASIACGPAREVSSMSDRLPENLKNVKIIWTLLDQDNESLEYARSTIKSEKIIEPKFVAAGIKQFIKKEIELGEQDLIYSLGLFDYLEDKVAGILISRLYDELKPGGMLLVGNFHPRNPLRVLMEGAVQWYLIHRTEEELLTLGKTGAPNGRCFVMNEPGGVNLILVISKPVNENN
jgi:predicted acylesterase/phospholipase RssA